MPTTRVKRRFKLSKNELSDAEFLASVDREWIKVSRTLKRPNLEPLTFEDENKGTVKGENIFHNAVDLFDTTRYVRHFLSLQQPLSAMHQIQSPCGDLCAY